MRKIAPVFKLPFKVPMQPCLPSLTAESQKSLHSPLALNFFMEALDLRQTFPHPR